MYVCMNLNLSCRIELHSLDTHYEFEIYIKIITHIVANSRPPACERPRNSNCSRVAHRSDNSVVTLLGTTARS